MMFLRHGFNVGMAALAMAWGPGLVYGQTDVSRRELATPGLVLETGSRTAACDVLTFTNNGQFLFATGDDKVVRTWQVTPKGLATIPEPAPAGVPRPVLRWASHRERRGNIYAAAISPDPKGQYIAVGGMGVRNSQWAVLDRYSGEIVNAVPYLSPDPKVGGMSIWAMAFAPSGDQVACGTGGGSVWVWDWKKGTNPVLIGQHEVHNNLDYNYVRFLTYDKDQLISADEQGSVYRWHLRQANKTNRAKICTFSNKLLIRFYAMSPDAQWLAAAPEENMVEIRSLQDGNSKKTIDLDKGTNPVAVAFNPQGNNLAVSLRTVDPRADFLKELAHKVTLYDIRSAPKEILNITASYRVETLAFHPDGRHLATAGGINHDVNLYDLAKPERPLGEPMAGPGECIWNVSLSEDGRYIGFQTQRNQNPDHPNRGGRGTRRVFDLQRRLFTKDNAISWTRPALASPDGWQVKFSVPDVRKRADQWYVQKPGMDALPLPWDTKVDEFPRCYAFLPQTPGHPTRLVVGHQFAASIFELTASGPRRTRILTGHDSVITSLAVSADGKRLVTSARDQTIAGWSLEDWSKSTHPQLGAHLYPKDGKLWVGRVDQGSPIWEAGLSPGDELVLLVIGGRKIIYNRSGKWGSDTGTVELALKALDRPIAGIELYFGWKRQGDNRVFEQLTNLHDRPIWRFFPTKDEQWMLWRCQDFLYDTSTRGDSLIGWQRNVLNDKGEFNVKGTPVFYRAEQFRKSYHNPDKVSQTVLNWSRTAQGKSSFMDIEPPKIQITAHGAMGNNKIQVKDKPFQLSIKITPNSERQNQELTRVLLWINDFQFMRWEQGELQKHVTLKKNDIGLARGVFAVDGIAVPPAMLRSGENIIFVQSYNKADVRGESERILVKNLRPLTQAHLHGLFIGVGKYLKSNPRQINLEANLDAEVLADVWKNSRPNKQYAEGTIHILKDNQVTPTSVLREFDELAATVKPDDLLVFHLGGHGVSKSKLTAGITAAKVPREDMDRFNQQLPGLDQFLFLCGNFDFLQIRESTISLEDLYEKLVKLPCHKVITLDACNAAAVDPAERKGTDIIRLFTKDDVGPIIFAACKAEEFACERPGFVVQPAAGLFAQAIVKTIDEDFARSNKRRLEPADMFASLQANVESFVQKMRQESMNQDLSQHPQFFLPDLERNFAILVGKD